MRLQQTESFRRVVAHYDKLETNNGKTMNEFFSVLLIVVSSGGGRSLEYDSKPLRYY
jgi:hypothetical protein